jgi:hypothetical protein
MTTYSVRITHNGRETYGITGYDSLDQAETSAEKIRREIGKTPHYVEANKRCTRAIEVVRDGYTGEEVIRRLIA